MPLWTILTKWPAPVRAAVQPAALGRRSGRPRTTGRARGRRSRPGARASKIGAISATASSGRRRPSGSSRARGRTRRRWCRRRCSGCPARCSGPARSTSSRYHELPPSISVSPGSQQRGELGDRVVDERGRDHQPDVAAARRARRPAPAASAAPRDAFAPRCVSTAAGVDVVGDAVVPARCRRRTMLAPMRPRPTMPSWTEGAAAGRRGSAGRWREGGTVGHAHRLPRRTPQYGATAWATNCLATCSANWTERTPHTARSPRRSKGCPTSRRGSPSLLPRLDGRSRRSPTWPATPTGCARCSRPPPAARSPRSTRAAAQQRNADIEAGAGRPPPSWWPTSPQSAAAWEVAAAGAHRRAVGDGQGRRVRRHHADPRGAVPPATRGDRARHRSRARRRRRGGEVGRGGRPTSCAPSSGG